MQQCFYYLVIFDGLSNIANNCFLELVLKTTLFKLKQEITSNCIRLIIWLK